MSSHKGNKEQNQILKAIRVNISVFANLPSIQSDIKLAASHLFYFFVINVVLTKTCFNLPQLKVFQPNQLVNTCLHKS